MGNKNSGPRPRPTAVKILRGVKRKDRLNPAEAVPPPGDVVMPPGLTPDAVAEWEALAPVCLHMGTLTTADVKPFAMLCELEASLALARRWKTKPQTQAKGLKLEKDLATIIRQYYALFGLEPVSRARIAVAKAVEAPVRKWAGVLA